MEREMNALTRGFFRGDPFLFRTFSPLFGTERMLSDIIPEMRMPDIRRLATDVHEDDAAYYVTADMPGISKDDIKLSLNENTLTILGERHVERGSAAAPDAEAGTEASRAPRYVERSFGRFVRTFTLPPNVDRDAIKAAVRDGVLTVTLPKCEEAKAAAKEIPIEG